MDTLRRALKNSFVMVISQGITWTSSIILTAALGRYLGDQGFGELYLAMSIALIFSVLVEFGLNQQLVRAVARDRELAGTYLLNSLAIKLVLSGVAYVLIVGLTYVLGYPAQTRGIILVFSLTLLPAGISTALTSVYQAVENVLHAALATVLDKVFVAIVAVLLLRHGYGAVPVALAFVAGAWLEVVWQGLLLRRTVPLRAALDRRAVRMLAIGALPFFAYWALGSVYFRIDIVLLSKMTGAEVVGWYAAAYRLFDTLTFLPSIVAGAIMYPILSRLSVQSRDNLRLALGKGLEVLLIVGIPICTGLLVLAGPVVEFLYRRPEFLPAAAALRWLAVGLLLLYINSALSAALMSVNQERKMTLVAGLAIVVNLALNLLLIPRYQHVGAAIATTGTELFILGYLLVVLPRGMIPWSTALVLGKASAAAGLMAVALLVLGHRDLLLLVPAGGLVYVVVALLLRVVPAEDMRFFRQAIAARRSRGLAEPGALSD